MSDYLNTPIGTGYNSSDSINTELQAIEVAVNSKLDKSGNTMTGQLDMNNNKIINVPDGTAASDGVNLGQLAGGVVITATEDYVQTKTIATMVLLSGITAGVSVVQTAEYATGNGNEGGATYDAVLASGVTPNGINIILGVADNTIAFVLRIDSYTTVDQFGAVGDGVTSDNFIIQTAINNTDYDIVLFSAKTYNIGTGELTVNRDGQVLAGKGDKTVLTSTGTGAMINYNGKQYVTVKDLKLKSITAAIGIQVGVVSHNFQIERVHIDGDNNPALDPTGFTTAGIQVEACFYGKIEHCDISFCAGWGIYGFREFNGNFIVSNSIRWCLIGLRITDTTTNSEGNSIIGNEIESGWASTTHGIQLLGADSMMLIGNRLEVSVAGAKQIEINEGLGIAQFNQLIGNVLEGATTVGIELGDGSGSSRVLGTYISGGKCIGSVIINSDCDNTILVSSPGSYGGALTDNGSGSIVMIDPVNSKWYIKQSTNKKYDLLTGGSSTILDVGPNLLDIKASSVTAARVDSSGIRAVVGSLIMPDGISAPGATAGQTKLYVDSADGDLKVIFGDGTIKTIATDT